MSPAAGHLRGVPDLADLTVRYVLRQVIGRASLRDFDPASVFAATEKGVAPGIAELRAVKAHGVIVEPRNQGSRGCRPEPVRLFDHVQFRRSPEVNLHLCCSGRLYPELCSPGIIDTRIRRTPHIGRSGVKAVLVLRAANACRHEQYDCDLLHQTLLSRHVRLSAGSRAPRKPS